MDISNETNVTVINKPNNSDKVKIAICLEQADGIVDSIMSGFSVNQLMNLEFYIFLNKGQHLEKELPFQVSYTCTYLDDNEDQIAGIMELMDLVLTEENIFAHMAGALGKSIWLITAEHDDKGRIRTFLNAYKNTCIVDTGKTGYVSAIRKVSLYLYFEFAEAFEPFSTGCKKLNITDVERIDDIYIDDINSISKILDVGVSCLNNIQIETTSICNLSCEYCPNSTVGREHAFMEPEMFYKIIDSLQEYLPGYSGTLSPHFYGEPLIDKRLELFIAYSRKKLPGSVIELYTNGELLTIDRYLALKYSGVDLFKISQHTELPSKVIEDTLTYIQHNHPELLTIEYNIFRDVKIKMNRGGLVKTEEMPLELMRRCTGCGVAHRVITFDHKGNAVLCCNDYLSKHTFGNILSKSIKDIWEGVGYQRARNLLMFGYMPFDMCKVCCGFSVK